MSYCPKGSRKNFFLISMLCLLGCAIWLFPKSLDSVKFLGFSDSLFIYKGKGQSGERLKRLRKPAHEPTQAPVYPKAP